VHNSIENIIADESIPPSYKMNSIIWNSNNGNIDLDILESYLRLNSSNAETSFRKLLSVYDLKKYKN
jgi:hypothetical protein